MKSFDYEAVAVDCEIYCVGCMPEGISVNDEEVSPIFADSEWDSYPVCCHCGEKHTYVNLTSDGAVYEAQQNGIEIFEHDENDAEEGSCWIDEDGEKLPSGWYWWSCEPGCLPDGEPNGPFDTESAAAWDAIA